MGLNHELEQVRRRLVKVRALHARAGTPGEKSAAAAAIKRLEAAESRIEAALAAENPPKSKKHRRPPAAETEFISQAEFEAELAELMRRRYGQRVAQEATVRVDLPARDPWGSGRVWGRRR